MKSKNWSYLAGIFDGEGSVHICKRRNNGITYLAVNIVNTNLALMKWMVMCFGGEYHSKPGASTNRMVYHWRPKGQKNRETFFLGILPYLIIKRNQVLLALEYERMRTCDPVTREQLRLKLCALNKGTVETDTLNGSIEPKIQSELTGDCESDPVETLDS